MAPKGIRASILGLLSNRGRRGSESGTHSSNPSTRATFLPILRLPEFSDKYTEWTSRFSSFTTLIESATNIDKLSKFIHLTVFMAAIVHAY